MTKPRDKFRVLLVYPNLPLMLVPPLSIGLFTHILKNQGYVVELFDTTSYVSDEATSPQNRVKYLQARQFDESNDLGIAIKWDMLGDFRRKVEEFKPDVLLLSVVEDVFRKALALLREVEDLNIPHLMGGVFPTAAPAKVMKYPEVQMVGPGEGERTIVDVCEAIRNGTPLREVAGIWYRDENGVAHKNPGQPLVELDECVPDFSLFEDARFYRPMGGRVFYTYPVETYRGCPYLCTYCNSPMQRSRTKSEGLGNFLRRKSMVALKNELEELVATYQPEFFYFIDDSFMARPRQEIFEFCDLYESIGLPFWFNTRPENCQPETMRRLKEVGCYRISFGIECGNEEYREKVLLRKFSNERLVEKFDIIRESGIPFSVNLIIGMPGETREMIFDTIEVVRSISGYDTLTVSIFTPYHGTVLRDVAVRNLWLDDNTVTQHTTARSILRMPPPYVSADDIDRLMRVIPLYVYFPKSEWANLERAETADAEGDEILARYSAQYKRDFIKDDQDDEKVLIVESATGCRSNPKDSLRFRPMSQAEVEILAPR